MPVAAVNLLGTAQQSDSFTGQRTFIVHALVCSVVGDRFAASSTSAYIYFRPPDSDVR